jgi:outer membrane receptor for ferrienterochelin and colicins
MPKKLSLIFSVSIIFLNYGILFADTNQPKRDQQIDEAESAKQYETVVTADRVPVYLKNSPEVITVITAQEIEKLHPTSTAEILDNIAGISIESGTGSGFPKRSIVNLNGLPPNYTLVLLNGARLLSDHMHSGQNIEFIPPESIEKIEIIQTAASAQYGSDAMGGVINIITKKIKKKPESKLYTTYGMYKTYTTGMEVVAPINEKIDVAMFADYEQSEGQPILKPTHRIDNMGYSKLSLLNYFDMSITSKTRAELYLNLFENRMDFSGDKMFSRLIMPKGNFSVDISKNVQLTSSLDYSAWQAEQSNESNKLLQPQAYLTWFSLNRKNQLTAGADYRYNWFGRTGLDGIKTQGVFGVFAHDTFDLNENLFFSASLRFDKAEDITGVLSPKIALLYRPIEKIGIRGSVSRSFHAPTVMELYEEGYGHGGTAYRFGNEDLKPEYNTSFSLSFEFSPNERLQIFINGYLSLVDNFITMKYMGPWEEDPSLEAGQEPTKDVWQRENILEAQIYGVETSAQWHVTKWLNLQAGYSYNGNKDETTDKQLSFNPGQSASALTDIHYHIKNDFVVGAFVKFSAAFNRSAWNWQPAQGAPQDNEEGYSTDLTNYQMLNAGAECRYKNRYKIFLNVNNILGQDIEELDDSLTIIDGEPVFSGGLKMKF